MTLLHNYLLKIIIIFQFGLFLFLFGCSSEEQTTKPNILLIMTDDQGWGDFGYNGNDKVNTPVLDGLFEESAYFERFYVSPVCAPTRASLLTGRYHLRTGVSGVTGRYEVMKSEEVTLAEILKANGYVTGCFGKWHNGEQYPNNANGQGFDEFYGFSAGHWNNYFNTSLVNNGRNVRTKGYITDVLTREALGFIQRNKDTSFFCYVPYNAPHSPFQVPDNYFEKYKEKGLSDKNACVYGMCENIDDNIGKILDQLDVLDLDQKTIVLFLTDNGPNGKRFNGGMKGIKGHVDEGGVRVPLSIRYPGITESQRIEKITAHIDIFPTILEMCKIKIPDSLQTDGLSLVPLLQSRETGWPERLLYTHWSHNQMIFPGSVRSDTFRLTIKGNDTSLFDMYKDPGQKEDISRHFPQRTSKMLEAYTEWYNAVTSNGLEPPPIHIGHQEAPVIKLPATECDLYGDLRYKEGHGWANDWIVNWSSDNDSVYWEVDILKGGKYIILAEYACKENNANCLLEVKAGMNIVQKTLMNCGEAKYLPSPDRVLRKEVYERLWNTLVMGEIELNTDVPGIVFSVSGMEPESAFELKSVLLKKSP